jgi:beta-phosphoglucomutase
MEKYKGIIFDFNGTLFFDNDKHVKAWNAISKIIRNCDITEKELHEKFNGTPNVQNIQYMMNGKATLEDLEKYSQLKEAYYRKFCEEDTPTFHLVNGVIRFFDRLKAQKIPFTIASASIKENIDFFIQSFHLDQWIDPDMIVYDDGSYKDKIAMFQDAARKINVPVEEIRVYEDSYSGIHNAYEAGCRQIVVICEKDKEKEYQELPGVIETMQDFSDVK